MRYAAIVAQQTIHSQSQGVITAIVVVQGTLRGDGAGDLRILAADRRANGEAFAGERVVRLPRRLSRRIRDRYLAPLLSQRWIGLRAAETF